MVSADSTVEYREIPDFPGYRVGDDGSVWSRWVRGYLGSKWKRRKLVIQNGYATVQLFRNKIGKGMKVHRLVLEAFVGPCPPGMECRHGDGVRSNNRLGNLSWGTPVENAADKNRHGTALRGERVGLAKLCEDRVRVIKRLLEKGIPKMRVARMTGASVGAVRDIAANKTWRHVS